MKKELNRTNPDYVIYEPFPPEAEKYDGCNCGLSVVETEDGDLVAVWEQVSAEQAHDGRLVTSRSGDRGRSWSAPAILFGQDADPANGRGRICFAVTFRNTAGMIYILMNRCAGVLDPHENGYLEISRSTDGGRTFSAPAPLPFPTAPEIDNPDSAIPPSLVPFLPPIRLHDGVYIGGMSHFYSLRRYPARKHWTDEESAGAIYRIENLEDSPSPREVVLSWSQTAEQLLWAPSRNNPEFHVGQEPSLAELPDRRVICVFRTNSGSPWYSLSTDGGRSWRQSEPLRYRDGGKMLLQPLSPCPLFSGGNGEFLLFFHNHDGNFGPWEPDDAYGNRRPLYLLRGIFDSGAHQPIRFGEPELFMDNNGVPLGHRIKRADLALYGSMTMSGKKRILWYPDRKHYLCGRVVPEHC